MSGEGGCVAICQDEWEWDDVSELWGVGSSCRGCGSVSVGVHLLSEDFTPDEC